MPVHLHTFLLQLSFNRYSSLSFCPLFRFLPCSHPLPLGLPWLQTDRQTEHLKKKKILYKDLKQQTFINPTCLSQSDPLTRHPYMPTGLLAEVFAWTGHSKVRPDIPKPHRTVSPWPFRKGHSQRSHFTQAVLFQPMCTVQKNGQFCLRFRGVSLDITQTRTKIMRP